MKYVIFAMAKMESNYIREWVLYHLKLGFTHIYIYDNEDVPTYKYILEDIKNVIVLHIPGSNTKLGLQPIVIHHFQKNYIKNFDFCIHLDIDEFLCLKKHKNIQEFCNKYFDNFTNAIALNWVFFGSNNLIKKDNRSVLERFTKCQKGSNKHIKLLIKVQNLLHYLGPHKVKGVENTYTKDTNGKIILDLFNENGPIHICQINHYKVKSKEEFEIIKNRPRADKPIGNEEYYRKNLDSVYKECDLNEIEDLHAYYFYKFN